MAHETTGLIPAHEFPSLWQPVRELGRGGMGRVFEVRHGPSGQLAALKIVEQADSPELLERFDFEARIMAGLRHPGLLRVLDICRVGHRPGIVLEKMAGSLADRIRREGSLDWREALGLMATVADGLEHAHSHGILHRDIKPANILLDEAGAPRLADFGLARLAADSRSLTETGVLLGTPKTMAPEQIETPRLIDARADIYALGATLYELLGGIPVVRGKTVIEVCQRVLTETPIAISQRVEGLPDEVNELVMACLAKDRHQRPQSAGELAEACRRLLDGRPLGELSSGRHLAASAPAGGRSSQRFGLATAVLGLVSLTAVAGWLAAERHRMQGVAATERIQRGRLEDQVRTAEATTQAFNIALESKARHLKMNRQIAQVRTRQLRRIDQERLERRLREAHSALAASRPIEAQGLALDGLNLCREADRRGHRDPALRRAFEDVRSAATTTSPYVLRVPARLGTTASALAFSPDGQHLGAAAGDTFLVWDLENGELTLRLRAGAGRVLALQVRPGGRSLVARTSEAALQIGPGQRLESLPVNGPYAALALDGESLLTQPKDTQRLELRRFGAQANKPKAIPEVGRINGIAAIKKGWLVSIAESDKTRVARVTPDGRLVRESESPAFPAGSRLVTATEASDTLLLRSQEALPFLVRDGQIARLEDQIDPIQAGTLRFSRDGSRFVVRGERDPEVFGVADDGRASSIPIDAGLASSAPVKVAISRDGLTFATGELGGGVTVRRSSPESSRYTMRWSLRGLPAPSPEQTLHARWIDSERFVVVDRRGEQRILDRRGRVIRGRAASNAGDPTVLLRTNEDTVRVVTRSGQVFESGRSVFRITAKVDDPIRDFVHGPGQTAAVLSFLGRVSRVRFDTGAVTRLLDGEPPNERAVFLACRDQVLLIGHADGRITAINPDGKHLEYRKRAFPDGGPPRGLLKFRSFGGGRHIAVFSPETGLVEISTISRSPLRTRVPGLRDLVVTGSKSPKLLISLDVSGRIAFYLLPSFEEIYALSTEVPVDRLEVSPNGEGLLAIGREVTLIEPRVGQTLMLNLDAGQPITRVSVFPKQGAAGLGPKGITFIRQSLDRRFVPDPSGARRRTAIAPDGRLIQLFMSGRNEAALELMRFAVQGLEPHARTRIPVTGPLVGPVLGLGGEVALASGTTLHLWPTGETFPPSLPIPARLALESPVTVITAARLKPRVFNLATADGRVHLIRAGVRKGNAIASFPNLQITALSFEDAARPRLLGTAHGEVLDWNLSLRKTRLAPSAGPPIQGLVHNSDVGFYALSRGPTLEIRSLLDDQLWLRKTYGSPIVDLRLNDDLVCLGTAAGRMTVFQGRQLKRLSTRTPALADPLSLRPSEP